MSRDRQPLPFAYELAAFYEYLASERQLSMHTLDNYQRDLQKLQHYCAQQGPTQLDQLDTHCLRALLSLLHRAGLGSRSLQRWLSSLDRKSVV